MTINRKFNVIGAIGDIHTEEQLLEKAVDFLKSQNVDKILSVGDIVDGLGDADRCCDILRIEAILTVSGNHERWLLSNQLRDLKNATQPDSLSITSHSFLNSLPATREFPTPHGLAFFVGIPTASGNPLGVGMDRPVNVGGRVDQIFVFFVL